MTKSVQHEAAFVALWVVSLVVGWRSLAEVFSLSSRNDEYTYVLLVLPISAALIFLDRRALRALVTLNVRAGSTLLVVAVLIACTSFGWPVLSGDAQLSVRMLALVLSWIGAFELCFGSRAARLVLFPLSFLFGLVPPPQHFLVAIVALLQQGSAWAAHLLFAAFGIPVEQHSVKPDVAGHHHGLGLPPSSFAVAKDPAHSSRSPLVGCQEWSPYFYDRDAWNSCKSRLPDRKISSPGRHRFLRDCALRHLCIALDSSARGGFAA
jgi:hypothetical protein